MKKLYISIIAGAILASNVTAQELTGDTKLACEAILCLSTGQRPSECAPSIAKFFSITAKKMSDTIKKRKNFLKLCPVDSSDPKFETLRDNVLANMQTDCTPQTLNARLERKYKKSSVNKKTGFYVRINPKLPQYCQILAEYEYTNVKLKNTCSTQFYSVKDWNNGYTQEKITLDEYRKLPDGQKGIAYDENREGNVRNIYYYKKNPINKECWINVKS